jgi:hypothetical protein
MFSNTFKRANRKRITAARWHLLTSTKDTRPTLQAHASQVSERNFRVSERNFSRSPTTTNYYKLLQSIAKAIKQLASISTLANCYKLVTTTANRILSKRTKN